MTLDSRRRTYWILFFMALTALSAAVFLSLPLFSNRVDASILNPSHAVRQWSFLGFRSGSVPAAAGGGILAALFATLALAYVLISFRKTASPEIFFFAFWILSLALESGRILAFRLAVEGAGTWSSFANRAVLAARFSGYGSLFLAGLHASGFRSERLGRSVASVVGIALAFASTLPLDTGTYEPTLLMRMGYARVDRLSLTLLAIVSLVNFSLGASLTGERRFRVIAIGAVLMLAGQYLLLHEWRPEYLLLAIVLLGAGSRLFISRLHSYYLWQ
ncbi:MAG: hypothetical protein WCL50_01195 [Spirochaetota bacterium]